MSWCVSLRVYPLWDSLCFLDLGDYFLSHLGKFLTIISSNIFSDPFFFSSSSGTPLIRMLVCLLLSQRSLRLSSFLSVEPKPHPPPLPGPFPALWVLSNVILYCLKFQSVELKWVDTLFSSSFSDLVLPELPIIKHCVQVIYFI